MNKVDIQLDVLSASMKTRIEGKIGGGYIVVIHV